MSTENNQLSMKFKNTMKVIIVKPFTNPYVATIKGDLESMQKAVGGLIEIMQIDRNVNIVLNEEGKLIGLEGNRRVGNHVIVGNFFICGEKGEDFCSLTDEQCEKYVQEFAQLHEITQDEIEEDTYIVVITF